METYHELKRYADGWKYNVVNNLKLVILYCCTLQLIIKGHIKTNIIST